MSFNYQDYKDYDDGSKPPKTNWTKALLPVFGFILVGAAAAIAWVLSEPLYQLIRANVAGIPDVPELQIVAGVVVFLVLVLFYGLLYSVFAPRPPKMISESELDREKQQKLKEAERAKRRKREMRNKMRQRNRQ